MTQSNFQKYHLTFDRGIARSRDIEIPQKRSNLGSPDFHGFALETSARPKIRARLSSSLDRMDVIVTRGVSKHSRVSARADYRVTVIFMTRDHPLWGERRLILLTDEIRASVAIPRGDADFHTRMIFIARRPRFRTTTVFMRR